MPGLFILCPISKLSRIAINFNKWGMCNAWLEVFYRFSEKYSILHKQTLTPVHKRFSDRSPNSIRTTERRNIVNRKYSVLVRQKSKTSKTFSLSLLYCLDHYPLGPLQFLLFYFPQSPRYARVDNQYIYKHQ